ncbi:hypothetical protein K466DRAFT_12375 [Polyporus arcularius HHB13444]|uniref:Uncharacterized protein n=1 Tax=Polyporus arcularius HHB13444 TaxID=1314778 RepID=A0A5C3NR89_9APHY|nr:hypothetical protein K466DRAFT_12375 [Polyporus arcularius HHB13444]
MQCSSHRLPSIRPSMQRDSWSLSISRLVYTPGVPLGRRTRQREVRLLICLPGLYPVRAGKGTEVNSKVNRKIPKSRSVPCFLKLTKTTCHLRNSHVDHAGITRTGSNLGRKARPLKSGKRIEYCQLLALKSPTPTEPASRERRCQSMGGIISCPC